MRLWVKRGDVYVRLEGRYTQHTRTLLPSLAAWVSLSMSGTLQSVKTLTMALYHAWLSSR